MAKTAQEAIEDVIEALSDYDGRNGRTLEDIQADLNLAGYDSGTPDGIMGRNTAGALARFITAHAAALEALHPRIINRIINRIMQYNPDADLSDIQVREVGPGEGGRIVAAGDSLAVGMYQAADALGHEALNLARSGAGFANGQLPPVDAIRPGDTVFVSVGTNDAFGFVGDEAGRESYIERVRNYIGEIQGQLEGQGQIVLLAPSTGDYPSGSQAWEATVNDLGVRYESLAEELGIQYLPTQGANGESLYRRSGDNLHYSAAGYRNIVEDALDRISSQPRQRAAVLPDASSAEVPVSNMAADFLSAAIAAVVSLLSSFNMASWGNGEQEEPQPEIIPAPGLTGDGAAPRP